MMETEQEALARLCARGFTESFHAADGELVASGGRALRPEAFTVDEIVRFEGRSDPDDEAMIFALQAFDGTKGTYLVAFGAWMDPGDVDVALRLRGVEKAGHAGPR